MLRCHASLFHYSILVLRNRIVAVRMCHCLSVSIAQNLCSRNVALIFHLIFECFKSYPFIDRGQEMHGYWHRSRRQRRVVSVKHWCESISRDKPIYNQEKRRKRIKKKRVPYTQYFQPFEFWYSNHQCVTRTTATTVYPIQFEFLQLYVCLIDPINSCQNSEQIRISFRLKT